MKAALLYPTVTALVEKMAPLFPEGLEVVGMPPDGRTERNDCLRRMPEWDALGLKVTIVEKPYSKIDFSVYDVLIESIETFNYSADWRNYCHRVECPIIVKSCWVNSADHLPAAYIERRKRFPFLLEMPSHLYYWRVSAFRDVTLVPNPTGDWFLDREWTGEREQGLFVLAGKDAWRPGDKTILGLDIWERLCERFPGKMFHHDGFVNYKTAQQMAELMSRYRVFLNLDNAHVRPLATSFCEALSAGMPVVARDLPGLSYKGFIDGNGVCTDEFEGMCQFIERCFSDWDFARECSRRSREIGKAAFSVEVVRPVYEAAAQRAKQVFESGAWK